MSKENDNLDLTAEPLRSLFVGARVERLLAAKQWPLAVAALRTALTASGTDGAADHGGGDWAGDSEAASAGGSGGSGGLRGDDLAEEFFSAAARRKRLLAAVNAVLAPSTRTRCSMTSRAPTATRTRATASRALRWSCSSCARSSPTLLRVATRLLMKRQRLSCRRRFRAAATRCCCGQSSCRTCRPSCSAARRTSCAGCASRMLRWCADLRPASSRDTVFGRVLLFQSTCCVWRGFRHE